MKQEKRATYCIYVQDFGDIWRDGCCGLNDVEFMFWIRMSEDGV